MAYLLRGVRVNYDNVAVGSPAGLERTVVGVSWVSLLGTAKGEPFETGGYTNISNGNRAGVEDTVNDSAGKLTTDGEDISDGG